MQGGGADGLSTQDERQSACQSSRGLSPSAPPLSSRKGRRMKLQIDPPKELAEMSETMQRLAAGVAVFAVCAFALSMAALLIALGGRSNGN